jgi:hypothetical protein
MARHFLYIFQYRKKIWGYLQEDRRKKMFSLKSMTKLEALTVPCLQFCEPANANIIEKFYNQRTIFEGIWFILPCEVLFQPQYQGRDLI